MKRNHTMDSFDNEVTTNHGDVWISAPGRQKESPPSKGGCPGPRIPTSIRLLRTQHHTEYST